MTNYHTDFLKPLLIIRSPQTDEEWEMYFKLRFEVLRKKWNQPVGSEKDLLEESCFHLAAFNENKIIAVGRIQFINETIAQVRYMAVDEKFQGTGAGTLVLKGLEEHARKNNAEEIILNARENAINFYLKNGYEIIGNAPILFDVIIHKKMRKVLL